VDESIAKREAIEDFLNQAVDEKAPIGDTLKRMASIAGIALPPQEISAYAGEAAQAAVAAAPEPAREDFA
jgi:hypothetical protein